MVAEMIKNIAINAAKITAGVIVADTAVFATKKVISKSKEIKAIEKEGELQNASTEESVEQEKIEEKTEVVPEAQAAPVETTEKTTKRRTKKEEKVIPQFTLI